ncbi:hypothetical protein JRO89_XS03G0233800 [Xanthoceras sorbifolium]|uniref:Centromere protein O n=1 Tax=Xanthoceras sorbifolium TaxID=99658 RepID=A0ABQ8IC09_9ROSI|nr:hypothetical protein JRO89_XS03G0233800 [Xanthoceras sorbifolium]
MYGWRLHELDVPNITSNFYLIVLLFNSMSVSLLLLKDLKVPRSLTVTNLLKRHGDLAERLSRDSDKMIFERLQKEFEAARASQTQEISLDGDQWNDGLLATIRERVHMEADRRAMQGETNLLGGSHSQEKITYKVGTKVISCLEGARIGIQYETSFAGEACELYHCVLESKSFLEKMTVLEHTVPFFLPIREAENDLLSSNAMRFIDHVGELLQAYVDRREQVRLIKELYGNQIKELYHSLPYHMIEFVLDDSECKVTVCLRYADLVSVLPTRVRLLVFLFKLIRCCICRDCVESPTSPSANISAQTIHREEKPLQDLFYKEAYLKITFPVKHEKKLQLE